MREAVCKDGQGEGGGELKDDGTYNVPVVRNCL
jgi:hypothetical protein